MFALFAPIVLVRASRAFPRPGVILRHALARAHYRTCIGVYALVNVSVTRVKLKYFVDTYVLFNFRTPVGIPVVD